MTRDSSHPPEEFDLPPRLREELARLNSPPVPVPSAMDAAILSRAKAGYAGRMRWRPVVRWVSAAVAGAAVLAIVATVYLIITRPPSAALVKGDIDHNGRVDMLDAFVLAKRVQAGSKLDHAWDVNGDGVVDQKDVDWIAHAAVSLGPVAVKPGGASQ